MVAQGESSFFLCFILICGCVIVFNQVEKGSSGRVGLYVCCAEDKVLSTGVHAVDARTPPLSKTRWPIGVDYQFMARKRGTDDSCCSSVRNVFILWVLFDFDLLCCC